MNIDKEKPAARLRFGIMCSGRSLPAAFAKCVSDLLSIAGVELRLLIIDDNLPVRTSFGAKLTRALSLQGNLWAIWHKLFPLEKLSCFRSSNMVGVFDDVPELKCKTIRKGKFSQYFKDEDIAAIRSCKLDFILRFGFGIVRGDILQSAKCGIWSFHHGDETKFRGAPPAFWEIYKGDAVTGAILQRLTDRLDGGIVLQRCFAKTNPYSHAANLESIMWASMHMPAKVCRDILAGSAQYLDAPPSRTTAPIYYTPNDFQATKFLMQTAVRWIGHQFRSLLLSSDWNIGIVRAPVESFLNSDFDPQVQWLQYRQAGKFIADPFVVQQGTNMRLLAEQFDATTGRGSIVELELDEAQMDRAEFRVAIDEKVHMSYPFAFEHEGLLYCVPESYRKRGVFLYCLDQKKNTWVYTATLIQNFAAVDPTLFQHDGRWWMFCTNHEDHVESNLYLWHAPELHGPWEPHPGNPVKSDVRSSRPAGRPFVHDGVLYRPAQDSSRGYGSAISINRIDRLSSREFSETTVRHIAPIPGSRYTAGIHTLTACGGITVIDGKRYIFTPHVLFDRIKKKLSRATRSTAPVEPMKLRRNLN